MAYKSILTVATDPEGLDAVLRAGSLLAQAQDGHLEVLVASIDAVSPAYYGQGDSFALIQITMDQAIAASKATEAAAKAILIQENPALRWSVEAGGGQFGNLRGLVAHRAMFSDVVVLAQPYGIGTTPAAEAVLEAVLFDGRAPVLMLPKGDFALPRFGRQIVVGWDQSREAMTAVRCALPLLIAADRVNIVVIDPPVSGAERSDPGGQLCQMLVRHGVRAEVSVLARSEPRIADMLLRHVRDQGADLLVMGAYGHSRLREAILGGATRDMLEHATVPVLLAH